MVSKVFRGIDNAAGAGVASLAQSLGQWPDVPLSDEEVAKVRKVLTELADAQKAARPLKDLPTGRYPPLIDPQKPDDDSEPTLIQSLNVRAFVYLDGLLAIHDGDHAAVAETVNASFNVARSLGDPAGTMGLLVYIANMESALRILNLRWCNRPGPKPNCWRCNASWSRN